ncbi:lysine-2,3-aminomutase-like protein [Phenylobacterium sp. SCN 70-31]|uniref:lysine-2,3-aminomutase-like protein n=1 Tax=Phenylobacterium sp. SCN 70-31 TaxID=1660129 RepID=UPI00086E1A80|nr:lysine-2,3-aminomutase-like protein [Phenylobacterium sp. SCN 70-31]ODT85670.1 MAG: lysine 2,3-aminomutase [Phenylobacterium sp. SCN 70-31]
MTTAATLRTLGALADAGLAEPSPPLEAVAARYAVAVTPVMVEAIGDAPDGPVGRQFLPTAAELTQAPGESDDPIGDEAHSPVAGIVHRYPDRVLLKANHACAVYCRFCFRREMVGPDGVRPLSSAQLDAAMAYVAGRPEIWEVIVTGGDPFVLSPRRLSGLMARLERIDHVKVVRFHTRVPAVAPDRVTPSLVKALTGTGKTVWVALHANHADELTPAAEGACARLIDAGIPMVSQSVLLRGVNDSPAALEALMRRFVEMRIKPYYLHHADMAPGTGHFRTTLAEGQALMRGLRGRVSGLCQPTYVLDIPGGFGKSPVGPCYVGEDRVTDPSGREHRYPT